MEKTKKRAQRRRDNARMLKRAQRVIASWYGGYEDNWQYRREKPKHKLWARQMRDNLAMCSCCSCGNPRRGYWNGKERLTMAERRNEITFHEELNVINELDAD